MCGRFTLTWDEWRRVVDALGIDDEGDAATSYRPRFNIAPTDQHFIITSARGDDYRHASRLLRRGSEFERRKAQRAPWDLVNRRAKDNSRASQCINAKAETPEQRASFREAFQQRRCVVPADGFFEWMGPKNERQPLWIHPKDGGLVLFAGLYEPWYPVRNQPRLRSPS
jgi:putative SOS response-associated peptidase YedK